MLVRRVPMVAGLAVVLALLLWAGDRANFAEEVPGSVGQQARPELPAPPAWPTKANSSFYLTMRDGVGIAVDLWVPEHVVKAGGVDGLGEGGQLPLVLQATRYWRELGQKNPAVRVEANGSVARRIVQAGMAYAVMDVRGTGASFGTWDAPFSVAETADIREVIDWLSKQPWCNGRVGSFGTSYVGTTAEFMGALGLQAVKAVVPRFSIFDAYGHIGMPGGVLNEWFVREWSDFNRTLDANDLTGLARIRGIPLEQAKAMISGVKRVDGDADGKLLAAAVAEHAGNVGLLDAVRGGLEFRDGRIGGLEETVAQVSTHGWRTQFEAARVPQFVWASWVDGATAAGAIARFRTFGVPQRVVIGPWNHGGDEDCDPFQEGAKDVESAPVPQQFEAILGFLGDRLKDGEKAERTPAEWEPAEGEISYWVMGAGEWRKTRVWPPAGTGSFTVSGSADSKGGTALVEGVAGQKGTPLGVIRAHESVTSGTGTRWRTQLGGPPVDYGDASWPGEHTVTLGSGPLDRDVVIASSPVASIAVTPKQDDGAVFVYLTCRSPEGKRVVLSEGMRRLKHGAGGPVAPYAAGEFGSDAGYFSAGAREVKPGREVAIEMALLPLAARVPKGWTLEVVIAAGDFGNFAAYPAGQESVMTVNSFSLRLDGEVRTDGGWVRAGKERLLGDRAQEGGAPTGERGNRNGTLELVHEGLRGKVQIPGLEGEYGAFELPEGFGMDGEGTLRERAAVEVPAAEALGWTAAWGSRARERLAMHPDAGELLRWLAVDGNQRHSVSLGFLLANMPMVDLGAMRAPWLIENVRLSDEVRAKAGWSGQLSDELFQRYVLPHRVSQEPVDLRLYSDREGDSGPTHGSYWRTILAAELWPRVRHLPMYEAAQEVNRWCWEVSGFSADSSARDQGPLTTIQREFGRCEEGVILHVCAARAVGIPARSCHTPYWAVNDNNHAWVEVWADGRWWFLGGGEVAGELNQTWFVGPASRAGIVISAAFGDVPDGGAERVYRRLGDVTLMNSTHVYGDVCEVGVELPEGLPGGFSCEVSAHVINFGTPRSIASFSSSSTIELGGGDYLLTADTPLGPVAGIARNTGESEGKATVKERERVRLTREFFEELVKGDGSFQWLKYPHAERRSGHGAGVVGEGSEEFGELVLAGRRIGGADRRQREAWSGVFRSQVLAQRRECNALAADSDAWKLLGLDDKLAARLGNVRMLAAWAAESLDSEDEAWAMRDMVGVVDAKALHEIQPHVFSCHSLEFLRRKRVDVPGMGDEDKLKWLCSPRVEDEPLNWMWDPTAEPARVAAVEPEAVAAGLADRYAGLRKHVSTRNGHVATPPETLAAGGGDERAVSILLVTMLRRNGVAARMSDSKQWAEFWNGSTWRALLPFTDAKANRARWTDAGTPEVAGTDRAYFEAPGRLAVACRQLGAVAEWPKPYAEYAVAPFVNGRFAPDWLDVPEPSAGVVALPLRPGTWYFFTTTRNGRGDALFRGYRAEIAAGEETRIEAEFGIPPGALDVRDLVARKLALWPQSRLERAEGDELSLKDVHGGRPLLVFVIDAATEPGRRMLDAVPLVVPDGAKAGAAVCVILAGEDGAPGDGAVTWLRDRDGKFRKEAGAGKLPCVILLDGAGETLLWTEGYNPSVRGLVLAGLGRLGKE